MCIDMYREGGGTDMTDGMVKRIAEKHSVFQSDVARFESAIREALQEYAASEWVDVRERMPEQWRLVLVSTKVAEQRFVRADCHTGNDWEKYGGCNVTHWRELPQAPAGTGEEAERGND